MDMEKSKRIGEKIIYLLKDESVTYLEAKIIFLTLLLALQKLEEKENAKANN